MTGIAGGARHSYPSGAPNVSTRFSWVFILQVLFFLTFCFIFVTAFYSVVYIVIVSCFHNPDMYFDYDILCWCNQNQNSIYLDYHHKQLITITKQIQTYLHKINYIHKYRAVSGYACA